MASLCNEVIKLSAVREVATQELAALIDRIAPPNESKVVFIEPFLHTLFTNTKVMQNVFTKEKGVTNVLAFQEMSGILPTKHAVYLLYPDISKMRQLVAHLLSYSQSIPDTSAHIFFVPRKSLMVEHILLNEYKLSTVVPNVFLGECDLDFLPLDDDVLTMGMPHAYKDLYVDGDIHALQWIASMIVKMQTARFGAIPLIRGKGSYAARVVQMVKQMQHEVGSDFLMDLTPEIEVLYVVDRSIDCITPFMTQLTYEGLIDELYGIQCGELGAAAGFGSTTTQPGAKAIPLTSDDKVFSDLRDRSVASVGAVLHQKSNVVKESYNRRKEVQQMKELKEFIKGLPELQETHRLLIVHNDIATEMVRISQSSEFRKRISIEQSIIKQVERKEGLEYIEEQICRAEPLDRVLRLLCLYSVVNGGLKPKVYDAFKENLMHVYGIPQMMAALFCLERAELLVRNDSRPAWNFASIRSRLRLWHEGPREQQPNDIAYAYSGYAPLLARVIEAMVTNPQGWNTDGDIVDAVPGEKNEIKNNVEVPVNTHVVMIVIIGGVTHAEISCLRFLQSKLARLGEPKQLVLLTTDITNGKKMLQSIMPFDVAD